LTGEQSAAAFPSFLLLTGILAAISLMDWRTQRITDLLRDSLPGRFGL
jgi:hypothetical protein